MNWANLKHDTLLKLPKPIRKLFIKNNKFDPIKEWLEEWEEHIYNEDSTDKILDKVRGNKEYINLALQIRMIDSAEKMEKLTKWIIILTISMLLLGIIQLVLLF